ncbi:TPA: hypothetical protein ACH3X2_012328 [Trebouxia sp. C0005]
MARDASLLFRGSNLTGNRHMAFGFETNADIDIRVWDWVQEPAHEHFIGLPQHCKSKYLLNWPGNSYSARLKYLLLCGSVVVHSDNGWYEFYYHMLRHGEHYMRVRALNSTFDLYNDLTTLIQKLNRTPKHSRRIANAGQHFAREVLSGDNVREYWYRLIKQYAELQTHEIRVHPDAVPLGASVSNPRYITYDQRTGCRSASGSGHRTVYGLPTGPGAAAAVIATVEADPAMMTNPAEPDSMAQDAQLRTDAQADDAELESQVSWDSNAESAIEIRADQIVQQVSEEAVGEMMAETGSNEAQYDETSGSVSESTAYDESESAVESGPITW